MCVVGSRSVFMNIDNQISRLAKQLPNGKGLQHMATVLEGLMGTTHLKERSTTTDDRTQPGATNDDELDLS